MGDRNHGMAGGVVALALVLSPAMAWAACPVQAPRTPKAELGGTAGQCAKLRPTRLRCSGDLPRRATTTQGPRIEVAKTGAVVACVTAPKPRMVAAEARCVVRQQHVRLGEIDHACRHRAGKRNACQTMRTLEIYRAEDTADGRANYCWVVDNQDPRAREFRLGVDFRKQRWFSPALRATRLAPD